MKKALFLAALFASVICSAQQVSVRFDRPSVPISPYMWGIFYEDINYSGDGGLNADLVQNGSFEYYPFFTPNYHVQRMFSLNAGDSYIQNSFSTEDQSLAVSTTFDSKTSELIVKVVNVGEAPKTVPFNIEGAKKVASKGIGTILTGGKDDKNDLSSPDNVSPKQLTIKTGKKFTVSAPAYSVQVIRIPTTK